MGLGLLGKRIKALGFGLYGWDFGLRNNGDYGARFFSRDFGLRNK